MNINKQIFSAAIVIVVTVMAGIPLVETGFAQANINNLDNCGHGGSGGWGSDSSWNNSDNCGGSGGWGS